MKMDALRIGTFRPVVHIVDSDFTARQLVRILSAHALVQGECSSVGRKETPRDRVSDVTCSAVWDCRGELLLCNITLGFCMAAVGHAP